MRMFSQNNDNNIVYSEGCIVTGKGWWLSQCITRGTKDKLVVVIHMALGATWQVTKSTLMTNEF